jgi:hypothetical protein
MERIDLFDEVLERNAWIADLYDRGTLNMEVLRSALRTVYFIGRADALDEAVQRLRACVPIRQAE